MAGGNKQMYAKLKGNILSFPVKISTAIYRGTEVAIDSAGYLIQAGDGAAMKFVGIAEESCTVAQAVADGTINIRVRRHAIVRMTKNTTSAVTDVGKLVYAHTTHSSSTDGLVGLVGATTYDNIVGLVVRREPDTPGGTVFDNDWLMVDITPAPWSAADISTHVALADQTAHTADGIAPVVTTESGTNPTITSAEFIGRLVLCTYAGVSTPTLPASGPDAGTLCLFVKASATIGTITLDATTLVGIQCASNVFVGCPNNGDSVLVQCVGADSYRVVAVNQARAAQTISGDDPTVTASQFLSGKIILSQAGATTTATTLPTSGVPVGTRCTFVKTGSAGDTKITAGTIEGEGVTSDVVTVQDAQYDVVELECTGANAYQLNYQNVA